MAREGDRVVADGRVLDRRVAVDLERAAVGAVVAVRRVDDRMVVPDDGVLQVQRLTTGAGAVAEVAQAVCETGVGSASTAGGVVIQGGVAADPRVLERLGAEDQAAALERAARRRGVSKAAIVREALGMLLARERSDPAGERAMRAAGAGASGLQDLGEEHNDYLAESYGV